MRGGWDEKAAHMANEQKVISNEIVDLHYQLIDTFLGLVRHYRRRLTPSPCWQR
jgi:hypothetical protein